ncbi:MAG: type IV toxin-antitoxin system AbiEi family antitoxin domain-containing protein [Defluviitaleaceae bacterium]|nr:type IV toxin-antitoxin system AbiEi family antitoxin domain-containing protein [Defluviitaleaceae bacterium]
MKMDVGDKVIAMIEKNNGFITSAQITDAGIARRVLGELVKANKLYKAERGIYALPNTWEDEMFFLQYRFTKGIFSNETALYLHALSDRTPVAYTMTFSSGYNAQSAKKSGVTAKFAKPEIHELGVIEMPSPCGNLIRAYDKERTLCDIVKGNNACEISIVNQAMKTYAASRDKNMSRLIEYAEQLRVKPKILRYMEVLL